MADTGFFIGKKLISSPFADKVDTTVDLVGWKYAGSAIIAIAYLNFNE